MNRSVQIRLALMMFLQFFVWGSWYGQLSKYMGDSLHATGDQIGQTYAAFSIAMILAPFFVGMLADRFFSAQKVLGVLNLLGAGILFFLYNLNEPLATGDVINTGSWDLFYWTMLGYCLTFAPTIALTSSIALRHITNPEKEFPVIRVFGTLSWIAVVNLVGYLGVGGRADIFFISSASAAVLGIFSFTLPSTPPTSLDKATFGKIIGRDAFVLFKNRSFLIFFLSSILICIPLSFYYTWGNPSLTDTYQKAFPFCDTTAFSIENKMSLGQVSEVLFMLLLTLAYRKLGVKKILIIGLVAWIIRFLCFGYGTADGTEWMLYIGILLHGVCFDFFFVTGYIYTDEKAGAKIKSQAQGLITLATYGIGMFIGSIIAGKVKDFYTQGSPAVTNWTDVWLVPAGIAAVVLLVFLILFRDDTRKEV
jgi:nucleoside transporter